MNHYFGTTSKTVEVSWNPGNRVMLFGWRAKLINWIAAKLHANQEWARARYYRKHGY